MYFLYGDQDYLMEEAVWRLKEMVAQEASLDLNLQEMRGGEVTGQQVIQAAETVSLLSKRRLVIVRDVDRLSAADKKKLISYLDNPNPQTVLVLIARFLQGTETRQLRKIQSSALYKAAYKTGTVHKFSLARDEDTIERWLTREIKKRGKKISHEALETIIERVGNNLRDLSDAIERVCLYVGDKERIDKDEVNSIVVPSSEKGVFEMIDALAGRRRDETIYLLNKILRQGERPRTLLYLIRRQFRLIARAKDMVEETNAAEAASKLGVPPFVARKCLAEAGRFSREQLRSVIILLATTEEDMNTGVHDETFLLERLAITITG